jgi:NAD-dependent deacetylase
MKKITANITQNIDGLLQSAGCNPVYELHGSLKSVTCRNCGSHFPSGEMMSKYLNDGLMPHCINCHSVLKPDITFFGEDLPVDQWEPARRESITCDLMIVVGSSLTVFPAASLPELAFKNGAKLVILNRDPTYLDLKADVAHHGELAEFLPLLAEGI